MRCEANHSEFACGNSFFYIFLVVVAIAPYNTSAILGYAILHGTGQYLDSLVSGKIEVTQRQRHFNCMLYVFLYQNTVETADNFVLLPTPFSEMAVFLKVAKQYDFTAVASLAKCVWVIPDMSQ